jgi:predicted HTH domain antitoxin
MTVVIPERIRERFLNEILGMYAGGEISAGRAAEMLGISRAAFYQLLAEKKIPLPEKLNQNILKELGKMESRKD